MYSMLDYEVDHVHIPESAWREAVAKSGARCSDGLREELDDLDCARADPARGLEFKRVERMPYIFRNGTLSDEDRIVRLRPIIDPISMTVRLEPETEVRERLEAEGRFLNRWAVCKRNGPVSDLSLIHI